MPQKMTPGEHNSRRLESTTTGTLLNVFFPRWPARPIVRSARLGLRAACVQVDVCRHSRPHLPHRASQHWQTDDRLQVALRLS